MGPMKQFRGKLAVVTGGGTGMGRELCRQLAAEGCHVAMCDISEEEMARTKAMCEAESPAGTRITTTLADVSEEAQIMAFQAAVVADHETDHIHLLFNNAGIAGAGSFLEDDQGEWEKTFAVCWGGVYYGCRAFAPMLVAAPEGHLINTSSVNGFWASIGPQSAHTSYSAAKFAVKGFTEALINDFKLNAPHVKVSLVMPGHIGTSIVINSGKFFGHDPKELNEDEVAEARDRLVRLGFEVGGATSDQIRQALSAIGEQFRDAAPMTAAEAAKIILDGVREERWRILVGADAHVLDRLVREAPEDAYTEEFMEKLQAQADWQLGV
jgi:NAD(P)-dependent dehydrogenase (short-subunit alcohol dehydrogenase family)